jgi:hypothetical protein
MKTRILVSSLLALLLVSCVSCGTHLKRPLKDLPSGYIDSPFVVPDGTAMYFLHSVASTFDMLTANPKARPVTKHLEGHQAKDGGYWWNTDLYVSYRNPDGTWGKPQNLGSNINSKHLEHGPWVNEDQTVLIYSRESVTSDKTLSKSFIARRANNNAPWGIPRELPGALGEYGKTTLTDFHRCPSGNLYFWGEATGDPALYFSKSTGKSTWSAPAQLPQQLQSAKHDTQPWVNDKETVIYFNRRGEDANTQLLQATRLNESKPWSEPKAVKLTGFADASGLSVWGEPSFTKDGTMFFVRFDTTVKGWCAELMSARKNSDGGYGPPKKIIFEKLKER